MVQASRTAGRVLLAGLTLLLVGAVVGTRLGGEPPLPVLSALPDFALVSQAGHSVGLRDLGGHPFVADFIFTRCGGTCPLMTAKMARLQGQLPSPVRLVSFTVDPEHDTPAVLTEYARRAGATDRWLFLTGSRGDLYSLSTKGFKLAALETASGGDPTEGPFVHSSRLVLVDSLGRVRGYYDSDDEAALKRLVLDARGLSGRVARRLFPS